MFDRAEEYALHPDIDLVERLSGIDPSGDAPDWPSCAPTSNARARDETQGRSIIRLPILSNGLGPRETVCEFEEGIWPDGMALDAGGGVWVVIVVSNRVLRIDTATGRAELFLGDADLSDVTEAESAWRSGRAMPRHFLENGRGRTLGNAFSLAFGWPDLRTLFIGVLAGRGSAWLPRRCGAPRRCISGSSVTTLRRRCSTHVLPTLNKTELRY